MSVDLDAPVHLPLELFLRAQLVWRDPVPVPKKKKKTIRPQDNNLQTKHCISFQFYGVQKKGSFGLEVTRDVLLLENFLLHTTAFSFDRTSSNPCLYSTPPISVSTT